MLKRSSDVKEVVHVKVKKYDGFMNPETKTFALDPHVTRYEDLYKIIKEAFVITSFHISYLCRDDVGENIYLSLLTEWDLDAAFITSADPYLRLKVDVDPFNNKRLDKSNTDLTLSSKRLSPKKTFNFTSAIENSFNISEAFEVSKTWVSSVVSSINKNKLSLSNDKDNVTEFFPAKPPLDDADFHQFLDKEGRLNNPEDLWLRIYYSGIKPSLRKVVWRLLLNVFPKKLTGQERIKYMKAKSKEYYSLRDIWSHQVNEEWVSQISSMVWKDVLRTDRGHAYYSGPDDSAHIQALYNILLTYSLTHSNTSYCQGMTDIASPILMVMDDEAQAYICFCSLMKRLKNNFLDDGSVMSLKFKHLSLLVKHYDPLFYTYLTSLAADNMYFCYRWLLLEMKREFSFDSSLTVLEVMWSSLPPQPPNENGLHLGAYDMKNIKQSLPLSLCAKSLPQLYNRHPTSNVSNDIFTSMSTSTKESAVSYINCNSSNTENGLLEMDKNSVPSGIWTRVDNKTESLDDLEFREAVFNIKTTDSQSHSEEVILPAPEVLGCGNPFLMFICLAVLLNEKNTLMSTKFEYDDLVMHFDKLVRKHDPCRILSSAMSLYASYLKTYMSNGNINNELTVPVT